MDIMWELDYPDITFEPDGLGNSPLHLAACHLKCDVNLVQKMLDMGAEVNTVNALGQTPLHYMIQCNRSADIVKLLLDNGALVNVLDAFRESPLHYALSGCQYNPDIVRLLLEGGANADEQNGYEEEPLHLAASLCEVDVVRMLLENADVNVNALDKHEESPLHHALNALVCDPMVVQLLLNHRADVNQGNEEGEQPLHLAAYKCNADVVRVLLDNGALVNGVDHSFLSPLNHALNAVECDPEVVRLLLERGADVRKTNYNGEEILHLAAYRCQPHIIQLLLDHGAPVNALDVSDRSPLHCALSVDDSDPEVIELLINSGSNLSQEDRLGQQPLHLAAFRSDPDTVRLLLDHGASPNALNMLRCSPLLNAVFHKDDDSKVAVLKLLLEFGAKVFLGLSPSLMAGGVLNEDSIRSEPERLEAALQSVKLLIKYSLLETPVVHFKGICTDRDIAKSLLHFNRACLIEICSKCPDRDFALGQFLLRQRRQREDRDVDEILRVLYKKPYPLYKEVLSGLLTKRQLRTKLEDQIEAINVNCLFKYTVTLNHVALNHIVTYISDHEDLLNLSLAFYAISEVSTI